MEQQDRQKEIIAMVERSMQTQRRAVRACDLTVAAALSRSDRELLRSLGREERRHYYFLEGICEELTGCPVRPRRSSLSWPRYYPDMLRTAICDKLSSIDRLEELRRELHCPRQQALLDWILDEQKEQARILAGIYRRCH